MMGKILGNTGILFLLTVSCLVSAQGVLQVVDEMGSPLKGVQAGRPFTVELNLSGGGALDEAPVIEGIDQFEVQDSSWSHSVINGEVSVAYRYNVVAQKPGDYIVGPALFSQGGAQEVSNSVQVEVGTERLSDEKEDAPVLVRLSLDKDRAVVGERIIATLRYYYTDPSCRLRNFIEQTAEDITRKKARGPRQGTEYIDDVEYDYIEMDWDMYPKKTGEITVPAFAAEYEAKMPRNPMFGGISRLLGMASAQKRVYSNAVTIQVDPLPASDQTVQGVGAVDIFELSANPAIVSQGEGAVLTLTLKGDFDPDQIEIEGLRGVPNELRYYESKESSQEPESMADFAIKEFEYIVQGLQTGSFEIPAQAFHYYDVDSRSYKTITTAPLSMTIMPGAPQQAFVPPSSTVATPKKEPLLLAKSELRPTRKPFTLPWWTFFLLVIAPFFVWIFRRGHSSFLMHRKKTYRSRRARTAFSRAQAQLGRLQKEKKSERIYALFIELFSDKWQIPIGSITTEYILQRLQDIGMPETEREQWNAFFEDIAQQAFGAQQTDQQTTDLFKKAEQWLKRLQQLL